MLCGCVIDAHKVVSMKKVKKGNYKHKNNKCDFATTIMSG